MEKGYMPVRDLRPCLFEEGDYKSVREVLQRINRIIPDNDIFVELDENRNLVHYTAHDVYELACNLGDGLIDLGLKDAHIAIVSDNSVRYVLCDMCISSGVGVFTPIDRDATDELLETLLSKCDASAVFCSVNCLDKVEKAAAKLGIKHVFTLNKKVENHLCFDEIVEKGKAIYKSGKGIYRGLEIDTNAPAKILFTSGTTGANKGVVLTNANLAANLKNVCGGVHAKRENNTSMSVLPMHHATEINTHLMSRIASGDVTYINDSIRTMMTNIKIFKPYIMTIVPMIANAFYKTIWANAEKAGKAEKLRKGIKISNFLRKFGIDITHKMFSDIYEAFGGNLEMIVCGGALLNPVVVKGLNDIGIHMENGYGITECGPLISINADTLTDYLSVGKVCPGLEAKIANPDENGVGELCIRGASVSKGYYKDPEATKAAFGEDGFFNTGDSARISKDGRIYLVGRKKNTIVLPSGKNINPEEVENIIETNLPYVDECVVYQAQYMVGGNTRDVICAGLYIKDEAKRADKEAVIADINKVNAILPGYKAIDYVELPTAEYEKTSTKKIKRAVLPTTCSGNGIKMI